MKSCYFILKGGSMKREVITAVAVLSLVFAFPVFAVEGNQPPADTTPNFEQMKADHLRRLDAKINSLQQEKACAQAAKNQDDLRACRKEIRRRGGPHRPGGQIPPQMK
jgi:hypothetical protein